MESEYDPCNEQPLDLVKRKVTDGPETQAKMGVSNTVTMTRVGSEPPVKEEDVYLSEEDGNFYSMVQNSQCNETLGVREKVKKFVLKVPTIKQEAIDGEPKSSDNSQRRNRFSASKNINNNSKIIDLEYKREKDLKSPTAAQKINEDVREDRQEELRKFVLQSPNLYSALCLNKTKSETPPKRSHKAKKKPEPPEVPLKDSSGVSAAYLEVFDKLMAEYMKKLHAQGGLDNIENTVDGINVMLSNIAAYEQKLISAMYMGSLLNSSYPGLYPGMSSLNPLLSAQGLNSVFSPTFPIGFASSQLLQNGINPELLGSQLAPLSTYHNLVQPERSSSTPMSPPAASPASVSSSTTTSAAASHTTNKTSSQESLLRVKDFQPWRTSTDAQSSTPLSNLLYLATPTDLTSNDESMFHSISASSGRSSSVSSSQNLTLSPLSSVGASPPLSSKSDSFSRSQLSNFSRSIMDHQKNSGSNSDNSKGQDSGNNSNNQDKKKPHIKKPLNAFMLYMKEMRQQVVSECTLKESAAINQILGRRWHALSREEQARYYELARKERQLHMQLYPDWSSRANTTRGKKRKRKQETNDGGNNMKKCRARYGLDQQSQWCKPCRRKKKCIRYMEAGGGGGGDDGNQSDDNLGSCGSVGDGDAHTPVDDDDDDDDGDESMSQSHSLSSPGGLSGLSSLTSPSMILPSPSTSLASPSVSLASPCMSLQSPLTPLEYECKPPPLPLPLPLPMYNHHSAILGPPLHRHPVGTNPHDINNPLSVNQLTGKCNKTETISSASSGGSGGPNGQGPGPSAPAPAPSNIIRVT
ncbi:uncharacterized protein LOC113213663 isoform X2 [Frankliniella occidentalis]|uniref:dTCF n=1 Tax=Frankliniella occidentalis TaxID=133901 RepID=A0A6J1TA61_FRAOC|nr:uncharacterized protein LOC113213663 isoform X2 [Frankliniella occidentalis]